MIFNSFVFILLFLPISLIIYTLTPVQFKSFTLLLISSAFIIWSYPPHFILFFISLVFNYFAVRKMDLQLKKSIRKFYFTGIITLNLSLLFVYKYLGFFINNLNLLFKSNMYVDKLIVPLGLSFYTFQVLSYVIDVYKFKYKAESNIKDLALYFIMFPQLASGPIMRFDEIKPQMGPKPVSLSMMSHGAERFIAGLFKKVVIANSLAELWNTIKLMPNSNMSLLTSWVGILAFTFYIYFDFSGYMDMAIGVANMFGYRLRENFDYPYISRSVSEFWRRWHMTLGRWFRDYIYIPLGGSKEGTRKYIIATMTVWFVTGLWHGASWNFILWGMYFGVLIIIEKLFTERFMSKLPNIIRNIITMVLVIIGWVIFDTQDISVTLKYIGTMFGFTRILSDNAGIYYLYNYLVYFLLAAVLSRPFIRRLIAYKKERMNASGRIKLLLMNLIMLIISTAYILNQSYSPSMYIGF